MTAPERKPTDVLNPDVDWYVWSNEGWESASPGSVQRRDVTRGKAAAYFASETTGYLTDVRVWARYVRSWDRQDVWEHEGRDRAVDDYSFDHDCAYEVADREVPEVVPPDYVPDDSAPVWEFVHRSHPAAIPVWVCGVKGDSPPQNPVPRRAVA